MVAGLNNRGDVGFHVDLTVWDVKMDVGGKRRRGWFRSRRWFTPLIPSGNPSHHGLEKSPSIGCNPGPRTYLSNRWLVDKLCSFFRYRVVVHRITAALSALKMRQAAAATHYNGANNSCMPNRMSKYWYVLTRASSPCRYPIDGFAVEYKNRIFVSCDCTSGSRKNPISGKLTGLVASSSIVINDGLTTTHVRSTS